MGNCFASSSKIHENDPVKKTHNPLWLEYNLNTVLPEATGTNIHSFYELGLELGHGAFGITYLCTEKSTGKKYACKSISKEKIRTKAVRLEVAVMQHLPKHPNIVALKDTFEDERAVHLVMDLCEGGDLADRIKARGYYTERDAAVIAKTIIEVVQWCHEHGVVHRDLKPENFLFGNNEENASLKAIDFGLSTFFLPGQRFNGIVGSPLYMAPELLERNYGPEIDIWSAGVIIYTLLCGFPPFSIDGKLSKAEALFGPMVDFSRDPWPSVSCHAKNLVRRMLEPDPKKRLTAQEILDHPWLRNVKGASDVSLDQS